MRTSVGYSGGTTPRPTYRAMGDHTESIQVEYDPAVVSYEQLLELFWSGHDPATAAYGVQYAAILFYHDDEQRRLALDSAEKLARKLGRPVRTPLRAAGPFHPAEEYHQKYMLRRNSELVRALGACGGLDSTAAARLNACLGGDLEQSRLPAELEAIGLSVEQRRKILAALGR